MAAVVPSFSEVFQREIISVLASRKLNAFGQVEILLKSYSRIMKPL